MQLEELTLQGFKSFADTTRFVFDSGITAVIGPNGSGKSNLAEAIRWVLGEQSSRVLRGKSGTDVIFGGSSRRSAKGSASVSLVINNESGRLPIESPEVTLRRFMNRGGDSEYSINGDTVRLADIQQLLAEAGFGVKSYAVISQGTVDQYLTASPRERRELFDEACGIKALQLKKTAAQRKLRRSAERIHELRGLLHELEPHLRVLQRQIARYEQRDQVERELVTARQNYYHAHWHRLSTEITALQSTMRQAESLVAQARHDRQSIEQELLDAVSRLHKDHASPEDAQQRDLAQKLRQAEHDYEHEMALYTQAERHYEDLKQSLSAVQTARAQAERELAVARSQADSRDWWGTLRTLLHECHETITAIAAGDTVEAPTLQKLLLRLKRETEHLSQEDRLTENAQTLLDRLEGPLQAHARLQAIEQERERQVAAFSLPPQPNRENIERLTQALQAETPRATHEKRRVLEQRVEVARTAEIEAVQAKTETFAKLGVVKEELQSLENTILRDCGTSTLHEIQETPPQAEAETTTAETVEKLNRRLADLGSIDPLIVREYEEVSQRHRHLTEQLADTEQALSYTETLIRSLTRDIDVKFREQFLLIQKAFQKYFVRLFDGGSAHLALVETSEEALDDPSSEEAQPAQLVDGIDITVQPPGKKPRHLHLLSGGEKALTSLALLLAILTVQRPPFIVLDEVDAALDEANSFRFAEVLADIQQHTQVIVITHNRQTMGQSETLYGITMQPDGTSRSYSVKLSDVAQTPQASAEIIDK